METYKKEYLVLFNAVTDALEAMEKQNYGSAREILVQGQQKAEEIYIDKETDGRVE